MFDPTTGDLEVTDTGNDRVEMFLPTGTYLATFGSAGTGNEGFESPRGIAVNASGDVDVADYSNDRVDVWEPSQTPAPKWFITSTVNPSETLNGYLEGVSCVAGTAWCTAVGYYNTSKVSNLTPFAQQWNGSEWSLQSTPNPSGSNLTELDGVSCSSSTACMAVGYYENSSGAYRSLTETWNGAVWAIQSTPEPSGAPNSLLAGVACTASNACTAVGYYENSSAVEKPWAARWNGTTWTLQTVPTPTGAKETDANGVSCTSSTECTMVGEYENKSKVYEPFAERWGGSEWTVQSVPAPSGATHTWLRGVSCVSSTECMAGGYYEKSSGAEVPFAERWHGSEWTVQTMPEPSGTVDSYADGISCTSSTACTAAGVSKTSSSKFITFAESWNGTAWSVQSPVNDEAGEGWLHGGVSCTLPSACLAVGTAAGKSLAELYG